MKELDIFYLRGGGFLGFFNIFNHQLHLFMISNWGKHQNKG